MNQITIIGNLTASPEARTAPSGNAVTTFTVAVNNDRGAEARETDFFRVTAWRGLAENCAKYLDKGNKVCVVGSAHLNTYTTRDGKTRATLEVRAEKVEFLTPKTAPVESPKNAVKTDSKSGMVVVDDTDELPF